MIVVLALSAFAFGVLVWRNDDAEKTYQITVVVDDSSDTRWVAFKEGLEKAADDFPVVVNTINTEHFYTPVKQEELILNEQESMDALILQPQDSELSAEFLEEVSKNTPLVLVESDVSMGVENTDRYLSITADDDALGAALAEELAKDTAFPRTLQVGILSGNQELTNMQTRLAACEKVLKKHNIEVIWELHDSKELSKAIVYQQRTKRANVILALDDRTLEEAVDYVESVSFDIDIYGVGCSDANVFYLERGVISALIVPNEFQMGYEAVEKAVDMLKSPIRSVENSEINFYRIRTENIYEPENERMLFPLVQ